MKTKTMRRIAVTLFVLLMTSVTAWAGDVNITADGQTISDATTWENGVVELHYKTSLLVGSDYDKQLGYMPVDTTDMNSMA